jgi:hypothetical protein
MLMMFASVCRKACLYNFREHAVHCRELACFKYRHEFVRDVHFDIFKRAGISLKKEAPVNFLANPHDERSTLELTDVMLYGWIGENMHVWTDFTTCEIEHQIFYCATGNLQNHFKQNDKT